jgi:hypothetical protein
MLSKSTSSRIAVSMALAIALIGASAPADAQIVQKASKEAAKGLVKGIEQEIQSPQIVEGAKQVTKGMVDGVANAVPLVASQVTNQANTNRKALGNVARQVTSDAASGMLGATVKEVTRALGPKADGPLADTLTATSERLTSANVRALVAELKPDPATYEKLSAAMVRGAVSEMNFNFSVWPLVLAFVLGGLSTLLFGFGLMLLYLLFQRRREHAPEAVPTPVVRTQQPILTTR